MEHYEKPGYCTTPPHSGKAPAARRNKAYGLPAAPNGKVLRG